MTATITASSVAAVVSAPSFAALIDEYAAESAIDGMPPPAAKLETYPKLEAAGLLHVISAETDGELVGFISVLAAPLPHYGLDVAVSESFFVARAHRNTMAGLKLLRAAEDKARELGSPGLLVSAPFGGKLFELLPRLGYAETNRVFFKSFGAGAEVAVTRPRLPTMSDTAVDKVRQLEGLALQRQQVEIRTEHLLHAGMYARTVYVPAGVLITGTLIKLATILILEGDARVYVGEDEPLHVTGYNVLAAFAGRKQAFVANSDLKLTMIFPTAAKTVAEAEAEFTDEFELLASRRDGLNEIIITGEHQCLE